MRVLLLLLLLPLSVVHAADDPPYLAAAKERQRKAKAFEVTLTVQTEWKNGRAFPSNKRNDLAGVGTVKLAVDGEKFWCLVDGPMLAGTRDTVLRQRAERAFDGQATRTRVESEQLKGDRAGQLVVMTQAISASASDGWRRVVSSVEPLWWALHGFDLELDANGGEKVEGVWCDRYASAANRTGNTTTAWFDPSAGHLPRRVERNANTFVAEVRCRPTDELGWIPSAWTIRSTPILAHAAEVTITAVTVDSFELRDAMPAERFTVKFPVGSRVARMLPNATQSLTVAADGSLMFETETPPVPPTPPVQELPSLTRTLVVVGVTAAVFVGFVVLLKRLARSSTDSDESPRLPT